jgi:DNA-binding NtrC family response regulator
MHNAPVPSALHNAPAAQATRTQGLAARLQAAGAPLSRPLLKTLLAEAEAALIAEALAASNGTIADSARLLGLKRTTLVEKLKRIAPKAANEAA